MEVVGEGQRSGVCVCVCVGGGGLEGTATKSQRQNEGRSVRTYVGAGCS